MWFAFFLAIMAVAQISLCVQGDLGSVLSVTGAVLSVKWLGKGEVPVMASSVEVLAYNDVV